MEPLGDPLAGAVLRFERVGDDQLPVVRQPRDLLAGGAPRMSIPAIRTAWRDACRRLTSPSSHSVTSEESSPIP